MKKLILLLLVVTATVFMGCSSTDTDQNNDEAYQYIVANVDDSAAIQSYLEKEKAHGNDIDAEIKNGDTVLMIAARYTTNIEVLKTIVSYFPNIHKMNYDTDMSALDYLSRREGTDEMYKYLMDESVKYEVKKKVDSAKTGIVKSLFKF